MVTSVSAGRGKRWRKVFDSVMTGLVLTAVIVAVTPLILIIGDVIVQGGAVISVDFLTKLPAPIGILGGIANDIQGSFIIVGLATLIGVPLGVGAGIYFSEWPESRLSSISSFTNDVLAEFPSITLGIFAYYVVVLTTGAFSALAGAVALGALMIPIVARTTEESLKIVPNSLREASMALGIPRWKTVMRIVISTGKSGLATGILLSIARAAGETAPLLLTALGSNYFFNGLLSPTAALPLRIYIYGITDFPSWNAAAWGAALILVAFMLVLNLSVKLLIGRKYAGVRAEI
ncbi:MAG: phosphate ABC transporter permease PstA [Thaumarchaeota archaeon]|nr:phosphate ABC transporter permease PstA [Nitrososphaerota archaeon]